MAAVEKIPHIGMTHQGHIASGGTELEVVGLKAVRISFNASPDDSVAYVVRRYVEIAVQIIVYFLFLLVT